MSQSPRLDRRTFAGLLASLTLLFAIPALAQEERPRDRGIGGTGVVPQEVEGDRGIGGTGVLGTIRRFGSIIVNGLRITYPRDVLVHVDGRQGTAADLKVGHVVRVVAERSGGRLTTRRIDVTSEVVGQVEATGPQTLTVLSQNVSTAALAGSRQWRPGDRVAVSGLRRPDGTIVASLIERRDGGPAKVAGPVRALPDGGVAIGGLRLTQVGRELVGNRAYLEGTYKDGAFEAATAVSERDLLGRGVRRYSIEAYVQGERNGLRLGSGLNVVGRPSLEVPNGTPALAVVTATMDRQGRLSVEAVRVEGADLSPAGPGSGRGRGPGDRGGSSERGRRSEKHEFAPLEGLRAPPGLDRSAGPGDPSGMFGPSGVGGAVTGPTGLGGIGGPVTGPGGLGGVGGPVTGPGGLGGALGR